MKILDDQGKIVPRLQLWTSAALLVFCVASTVAEYPFRSPLSVFSALSSTLLGMGSLFWIWEATKRMRAGK
jgi:hypothetical protein